MVGQETMERQTDGQRREGRRERGKLSGESGHVRRRSAQFLRFWKLSGVFPICFIFLSWFQSATIRPQVLEGHCLSSWLQLVPHRAAGTLGAEVSAEWRSLKTTPAVPADTWVCGTAHMALSRPPLHAATPASVLGGWDASILAPPPPLAVPPRFSLRDPQNICSPLHLGLCSKAPFPAASRPPRLKQHLP